MILTNYLIDVLTNLSCLVIVLSALGCVGGATLRVRRKQKEQTEQGETSFFRFRCFCLHVRVCGCTE